jgi:hypothetical protein
MTDQQKADLRKGKWLAFGIIAATVAVVLLELLIEYIRS